MADNIDALLRCDETLDFSPPLQGDPEAVDENDNASPPRPVALSDDSYDNIPLSEKEFDEAVGSLVGREMDYLPDPGYVDYVQSNKLISNARLKAIRWFIQCQIRLNILIGTVFYAANYFDRFISLNKKQGWKDCMYELVAVSCIRIAIKFNDKHRRSSLLALQMEGLDHSFGSSVIQRMEMKILDELEWKMYSPTPFSYVQLMQDHQLKTQTTHTLISSLLDPNFAECLPCVMVAAALQSNVDDFFPEEINHFCFTRFTALVAQQFKDEVEICVEMMEGLVEQEEIWEMEELEYEKCDNVHNGCPLLLNDPPEIHSAAAASPAHRDEVKKSKKKKEKWSTV